MTAVTYVNSLMIAPGSKQTDAHPAWSEVGGYLRSFTVGYGRQFELDRMEVGTATFTLRNETRTFDPAYTRGPFYPNLRPGMPVKFETTVGGTTYPLFRGVVERIGNTYIGPEYQEARIDCTDLLGALAKATVSGPLDEQLSGDRILTLLTAASWPTSTTGSGWTLGTSLLGRDTILAPTLPLVDVADGHATLAAKDIPDDRPAGVLDEINTVERSEPGVFYVNRSGTAVFLDRTHFASPPASTGTISDAAGDPPRYSDLELHFDIDRVANDVRVTDIGAFKTEVSDGESFDDYGQIPLDWDTEMNVADPELWQLASWLLLGHKQVRQRVESVTVPFATAATAQAVLAREIGDRLVVTRTPAGAPVEETITQDSWLEHVSISGNAGLWYATLQLSPVVLLSGPGWKLGTSRLGVDTRLIYA